LNVGRGGTDSNYWSIKGQEIVLIFELREILCLTDMSLLSVTANLVLHRVRVVTVPLITRGTDLITAPNVAS
jgi:hypothetical protein